ncbi:T9SS type A sorting domain-containing protein [Taibaiella chishuiensis]|uniref:Putative secreted protein (Por secretion system target) n=1 Tax=Taibaiella chishuiensis TaxID=1434707 RepID=A0A2P8DBD7_9BACT|nr:T9SS type A sorting domain-containing protein [Taibaiella chishuiensis]PSK94519.1 putative secreted protein (Por secretion system target) [Taibaiella chishuiensis]
MKKNLIPLLFLSFAFGTSYGQSASGDCSSISVTSNPGFTNNLWGASVGYKNGNNSCNRVITSGSVWQPRYQLQSKSGSSYSNVGTWQYGNATFSGLAHGTYRIAIENPQIAYNVPGSACTGTINCYNLSGTYIGLWGIWASNTGTLNPYSYTNDVVVGQTTAAENTFNVNSFVSNGTGSINVYDFGQDVKINVASCYNYNQYQISIFEQGGANRYGSTYWQFGTIPSASNYSLTNLWKANHGSSAQFEPGISYKVQFVVTTQNCAQWNEKNETFFICPAGVTGCRFGQDIMTEPIRVHADRNTLSVFNLDFSNNNAYEISINSLDGRRLQTYSTNGKTQFDISSMVQGMYLARIVHNGKQQAVVKFVK